MDQAEQLRILKANQQQSAKPLARVITVTSGKGGVGKSNTSIHLPKLNGQIDGCI